MDRYAGALRGLGWCAIGGAVTTLLNTVLPNFYAADGFDARAALIHDPFYAARQWVLLVHPGFTLLLALGLAFALRERAPGRAGAGLIFAGVEKMTEFLLGVTILFVVNATWKAGYLAAPGTAEAALLRLKIETVAELIDGTYALLWAMFILSTACFATALDRRVRLERWVALTGFVMIGLTALMILGSYGGQDAWVQPIIRWAYPPMLTLHRLLIGLWLLRLGQASAGFTVRGRYTPASCAK